jgi:hypothetical protein
MIDFRAVDANGPGSHAKTLPQLKRPYRDNFILIDYTRHSRDSQLGNVNGGGPAAREGE